MLTTMAVGLLSVLILGLSNGSATGDIVQVLVALAAIVLVASRLSDEQGLEPSSGLPPPAHRS